MIRGRPLFHLRVHLSDEVYDFLSFLRVLDVQFDTCLFIYLEDCVRVFNYADVSFPFRVCPEFLSQKFAYVLLVDHAQNTSSKYLNVAGLLLLVA